MPARLMKSANADRRRFIALYATLVAGLLTAAMAFIYEAQVVVEDGAQEEVAYQVLSEANRALHDLENTETGQRGYLLTGDESYLLPYRQGTQDVDDTILRLQRVVAGDPSAIAIVERIEHAKNAKIGELAHTIELERSGHHAQAIELVQTDEGKQYMDSLRSDFDALINQWRQKHVMALNDARARVEAGTVALLVGAVLTCCLLIYTLFIQRRAFAKVSAYSIAMDREAAQDALTGLPNRRRLLTAIDELASRPTSDMRRVGIFYLDIDGFKSVNDALGHSAGDALLRTLANSLSSARRQSDMLARVGGDEFVVLMTECGDDAQLREFAGRLISRVRGVGESQFGGRFPIGVSIGIATYPDSSTSITDLLDIADAAMYAAKRGGRSTYRFGPAPVTAPSNVVQLTR